MKKKIDVQNERFDKALNELEENMKSNKKVPFDKKHVIIENTTIDSINKVINEAKKVIALKPKLEQFFDTINRFTKSHQALEKENKNIKVEVNNLKKRNQNLVNENSKLRDKIKTVLKTVKDFFRTILKFGNEPTKEATVGEIKAYYDDKYLKQKDIFDIAIDTTKEDELFEYADITKDKEEMYYDDYYFEDEYGEEKDFDITL